MTTLIQRNTTIPTKKSETFSTAEDSQPAVTVHVLQGERPMARDNRTLGKFNLEGIPPAPRGVPQIEVAFDIDANGIVNVHARDKATGKEQKITITASSGLSEGEIQKMVKDAEAHEVEDKRRREEIELKNKLDALIYSTEKAFADNKDKLSIEDRADLDKALDEAKQAVAKQAPLEEMQAAHENLTKASHKIAEAMYKAAGGTEPPPGGGEAPGAEPRKQGDVVDAEFEEAR
jgi:molecular chaperone DnaK